MRIPSPEKQRSFILDKIKEWSDRLKLAEWKIAVEFLKEKDDYSDHRGKIGLGKAIILWLDRREEAVADYSVLVQFRESYYKEDWEPFYSSFKEMAELVVIHELIHIKMGRLTTIINAKIGDSYDEWASNGNFLQEHEWLVDNLARTLYDLKYSPEK